METLFKTINQVKIKYETKVLDITTLMYYPQNPRIMEDLEKLRDEYPDLVEDQQLYDKIMWSRDQTHTLYQTIKKDGGLNEALLVYNNFVIEGNTRLCCLKRLAKDDSKWLFAPCEVIVDEITPLQINRLLIDKHVIGKNEWSAYGKSLLYYRLKNEDGLSAEQIADLGHESVTKVYARIQSIEAFKQNKCTDTKKYSHFEQLVTNQQIKKLVKDDPRIYKAAVDQILTGTIPDAQDVRLIPTVCNDKDSKKRFLSGKESIQDIVLDLEQQKKLQNKAIMVVVKDLYEKLSKMSNEDLDCLKENNADKAQIQKLLKQLVSVATYAEIKLPGKLKP